MNQAIAKAIYVAGVTTFCTFLGGWAVLAYQENTPRRESARHANAPYADEVFLRSAAEGSMTEVKLAQLAEEKAQSEEVKKFAKRMVEEHSKATEELKQIGTREGIDLPTDWSRKHAEAYDRLEELSGAEFDRAYARDMVQDHEQDVNEFKRAMATAKNPALNQFAALTLPTLEAHLQEAKEMMEHVSREGMSKGPTGGASHQK
jgi:putative membrane protein